MSDPRRLTEGAAKIFGVLDDTDLSTIEKAAICRVAAEAFSQAQVLEEIAVAMAKNRGR